MKVDSLKSWDLAMRASSLFTNRENALIWLGRRDMLTAISVQRFGWRSLSQMKPENRELIETQYRDVYEAVAGEYGFTWT